MRLLISGSWVRAPRWALRFGLFESNYEDLSLASRGLTAMGKYIGVQTTNAVQI